MAWSQQTLVKQENTEGNNYGSQKIKDFKGNRTNSLGSKGQIKNFSRKRYLSGLYNRTSSIRKEFV